MLFASDLDRTLVYSDKFIKNSSGKLKEIRPVEYKDEEIISYMSERTISKLKDICKNILFVPVTTRTIQQFKRINLFKKGVKPKYSVVSNGGNIIVNGNLDLEWNSKIIDKIGKECINIEDAMDRFNKMKSNKWVLKSRKADDLFFYSIINREKTPYDELKDFSNVMKTKNWRTILHGRKLYFIPRCVNKRDAIAHVADKENKENIIAAGDSVLDLDMAEIATHFISPKHGEIYKTYRYDIDVSIEYTENTGIIAGEEIIDCVINKIPKEIFP